MQIVTNPGSNLMPDVIGHYGIALAPQRIIVGTQEYDTRRAIPFDEVDAWVRESKEFPYVVGTTATEFLLLYQSLAKHDSEILVITSSRKIIQSHAAALSAARSLAGHAAFRHLKVAVVDSGVTDIGAGVMAIMAGEAARAGLSLRATVNMLEVVAARARYAFIPQELDNLVKGGRASWVRALLANVMKVRPIIAFVDGELRSVGTVKAGADHVEALAKQAAMYAADRKVWVGVSHAASTLRETELVNALRRSMNVEYVYTRPLHSSVYLHVGPGTLTVCVLPVDDLPWTLPVPKTFAS